MAPKIVTFFDMNPPNFYNLEKKFHFPENDVNDLNENMYLLILISHLK